MLDVGWNAGDVGKAVTVSPQPGSEPLTGKPVDVAKTMAEDFREIDEADPQGVAERRREAAARLLANGFSDEDVGRLHGDVLVDPSRRP